MEAIAFSFTHTSVTLSSFTLQEVITEIFSPLYSVILAELSPPLSLYKAEGEFTEWTKVVAASVVQLGFLK